MPMRGFFTTFRMTAVGGAGCVGAGVWAGVCGREVWGGGVWAKGNADRGLPVRAVDFPSWVLHSGLPG
jgi:hypothetical protein